MDMKFKVGDIVWASAKRCIFWPAKVLSISEVYPNFSKNNEKSSGMSVRVHFYGEDTIEEIKHPKNILKWSCAEGQQFIKKGREMKDPTKKLLFNKGVKKATDEARAGNRDEQQGTPVGSLRRSPRVSARSPQVNQSKEKHPQKVDQGIRRGPRKSFKGQLEEILDQPLSDPESGQTENVKRKLFQENGHLDRKINAKHMKTKSRSTDIEEKECRGKTSSTIPEICSDTVNNVVRTRYSRSDGVKVNADDICKYKTKSIRTKKNVKNVTTNKRGNKITVTKVRTKYILNQNEKKKQTKALPRVSKTSTKIKCKTKNVSCVKDIKGKTKLRLKEIEKRKKISEKQWASEKNRRRENSKFRKDSEKRKVNNGNVKEIKKNFKVAKVKQEKEKETKAESAETVTREKDDKSNGSRNDSGGKGGYNGVDQKVTQLNNATERYENKFEKEVDSEQKRQKSFRTKSRRKSLPFSQVGKTVKVASSCSDSELHSVRGDSVSKTSPCNRNENANGKSQQNGVQAREQMPVNVKPATRRGRKRKFVEESVGGLKRTTKVKKPGSVWGDLNLNIIPNQEQECFSSPLGEETKTIEVHQPVSCDTASDLSDDELPEAFTPKRESSQGCFVVGDLVWAKYGKLPYWPSEVKKVSEGKKKADRKIYIEFLCDGNKKLFRISPKNLLRFACEPARREALVNEGKKIKFQHQLQMFLDAVALAEEMILKKGLGKEKEESQDDEYEIVNQELKKESEMVKKQVDETNSLNTPSNIRKSSRKRRHVSKYSNILNYIKQSRSHLKLIYEGKRASERHRIFKSGTVNEKNYLKRMSGFGPIEDEKECEEIMDYLLAYYEEMENIVELSEVHYVSEVWLPEALIFTIQQIEHVGREKAEETYRSGTAIPQNEAEQLVKSLWRKRRLTDEETKEVMERAEMKCSHVTG